MGRLIFIPSYGTNSSLYDALRRSEEFEKPCVFTEWLPIQSAISLSEYAARYIDHYKIEASDTLIGVSLGGVLSIEIDKILKVSKIIIISSLKSQREKPLLFKFMRRTRIYRLFSPQILKVGLDLIVPLYGKNVKSYLWFRKVFKATDNNFLKWALKEIVMWENEYIPSHLVHIHGSKDPLFPLKNGQQVDYVINKGTHAMIRFNAKEIAQIIKAEI